MEQLSELEILEKNTMSRVYADGLNVYQLLYMLKKELGWPSDRDFPPEVVISTCNKYIALERKPRHSFPWFKKVMQMETFAWYSKQSEEEGKRLKKLKGLTIDELLKLAEVKCRNQKL